MLHGRDTHLLARATDPTTLNCRWLPDGLPHGLRATLWCPFLTPTTPTVVERASVRFGGGGLHAAVALWAPLIYEG